MQKFVKIKMRDRTSITLSIEEAEEVLKSEKQLIMLHDEDGNWTGQSINKAEIVGTERDRDEERQFSADVPALPSGEKDVEAIRAKLKKYKPEWMNK